MREGRGGVDFWRPLLVLLDKSSSRVLRFIFNPGFKMTPEQIGTITKIGMQAGELAFAKARNLSFDPNRKLEELPQLVALGLFAAAYKSFQSVCLLLDEGFEENAIVCSRSVIEISLQAIHFKNHPNLAERYVASGCFDQYRQYLRLKNDQDEMITGVLADRDPTELKQAHDTYVERFGGGKWHGKSTIRELAEACGQEARRDYLITYWLQSNLAHANALGVNEYVRLNNMEWTIRCGPDKYLEGSLIPWRVTLALLNVIDCLSEVALLNLDVNEFRREVNEVTLSLRSD